MTVALATAGGPAAGWLALVVPILTALFGAGGVVAYLRLRKESPNISVNAAQGAVIIQERVLRNLEDDLTQIRGKVRDLEQREEHLVAENTRLRSEVADLQKRVRELEAG